MQKIHLLGHANRRFDLDFFPCGTHVIRPACPNCERNLNELTEPLQYFWEFEFGNPQASVDLGNNCFWGSGFHLMINEVARQTFDSLNLPFQFRTTLLRKGRDLKWKTCSPLFWAELQSEIEADSAASKDEVCERCGEFTGRLGITRLRIPVENIPTPGIFTIAQNGAHGPIFVTGQMKEVLASTTLKGIGFYPAGRLL